MIQMNIHEVTMTSYLQCIFMIQMNIHAVNVTSNSSNGIAETSVQRLF